MEISFWIRPADAIRAARGVAGNVTIELTTEHLVGLSPGARAALAHAVACDTVGSSPHRSLLGTALDVPPVVEPTPEAVLRWAQAVMDAEAAFQIAFESRQAQETEKWRANAQAYLARDKNALGLVGMSRPDDSPESIALEAAMRAECARRSAADKAEAERAACAMFEAAKDAAREKKLHEEQDFADFADDETHERYRLGLLSERDVREWRHSVADKSAARVAGALTIEQLIARKWGKGLDYEFDIRADWREGNFRCPASAELFRDAQARVHAEFPDAKPRVVVVDVTPEGASDDDECERSETEPCIMFALAFEAERAGAKATRYIALD
jgi:hypothetical protein